MNQQNKIKQLIDENKMNFYNIEITIFSIFLC